jgi:hypothetical protein
MPFDQTSLSTTPREDFTCARCSSSLIQPLEWDRVSGGGWSVLVRCPECFQLDNLSLTIEQAQVFGNALDEASRSLEETADMLDLQVFRETWESFARALRAGLICPMDF